MGYKIRVSSRAIIINDNKILLNEFGGGKYYNFIGGSIEQNETAKQAVKREVIEESGLNIDVGDLVFLLEYEPKSCNYCYGEVHHLSFFFRCYLTYDTEVKQPTIPDINPDDPTMKSMAKWIPLSDLKKISLLPMISESLIKYIETGVFTPSFWCESEHRI